MKKFVNKLCRKNIRCNQCEKFTGYAGDDCEFISKKMEKEAKITTIIIIIFFIIIILSWPFIELFNIFFNET